MRVKSIGITFLTVFAGVVALTVLGAVKPWQKGEKPKEFGCFSWSEEIIEEEENEALSGCISQAGISVLYQDFSKESLTLEDKRVEQFVARMGKQKVKVYALIGKAEWAYDKEGKELVEYLQCLVEYNQRNGDEKRIQGVMVDVEPYLLEEWDEGEQAREKLMEDYVSGIERAYIYALQNQLKFWVCIPTFYDSTNKDILERLISYACDGVAVMNYNRRDEYGQMAMEVGFAREYGKEILCIYELQKPGKHELEEINTYANEGLEALWKSRERLEKQFGYDKLGFAYHYYKPLKEMLEEGNP